MEKGPEKMRKNAFLNLFMLVCVLTAALMIMGTVIPAFSQPGDGENPCPGGPPCNPEVPIAGIEWLLAIGGLFGFRKVYRRFRTRNGE